MKHLLLAMFLLISATTFAQVPQVNFRPQIWNNTPIYSNSGGYTKLVLNSSTNQMEYTANTLLSGKVVAAIETDSARNYAHTGAYVTKIKYLSRDTVRLTTTLYSTNQLFKFMVVASGADTTVFVPSSGQIDGASTKTMTGTNNSVTIYFDGTNYWSIK